MSELSRRQVGRRWILTQSGRGVLGIAVLGTLAACGSDEAGPATEPTPDTEPAPEETGTAEPAGDLSWEQVNLGFVSAYVLVRGNEAAVVDTGVPGSGEAIGTVLDAAGPGWAGVRHVVLTHKHPDHVGGLSEVLEQAATATGYVGAADLGDVDSAQQLTALNDGDDVFGLQVIATPGHTAGHMAVFDPTTGVLVAGDALTNDGELTGSNPQYTEDESAANQSILTMAELKPTTILVGHGTPLLDGAGEALEKLAASVA